MPGIVKILLNYGVKECPTEFILTNGFPNKKRRKKIVNEHLQRGIKACGKLSTDNSKQLYVYAKIYPENKVSH